MPAPQLLVPDVRAAMGLAAAEIHGWPARELTVIGVTGTNGKSTVVQLLSDIWTAAGEPSDLIGTMSGARTTPESTDLQRRVAAARDAGRGLVAMEVSSHALCFDRVVGTRFAAALFTNLGRDHLDFHGDLESYFLAKASLFSPELTEVGVVNRDDEHGARLLAELSQRGEIPVRDFGLADARDLEQKGPVTRFTWNGELVALPLAGRHNLSNALAAATAADVLGLDHSQIAAGLSAAVGVRGRFELVTTDRPFHVVIDYAHTPDALAAVLRACRDLADERVLAVFGCGGERDREKRPEMGRTVQDLADVAIVTSDNPRSEEPMAIIDAVTAGMEPRSDGSIHVEPDRRAAIGWALGAAENGDVVLIAGKGHETVQVIGDDAVPFDDRAVALEELEATA